MAFLASHRAAGNTGECLSIEGGMEGRIVSKAEEVIPNHVGSTSSARAASAIVDKASRYFLPSASIPASLSVPRKRTIQILLSVDFDAVSGWLGTGAH